MKHCTMKLALAALAAAAFAPLAAHSADAPAKPDAPRKVKLDLAKMSKTIRTAWAVKLLQNPEDFKGDIIQIVGDFYADEPEDEGGERRYLCALKDAAGCCTLIDVEFRPLEKLSWPKDFPEEFTPVTVNGRVEVVRDGKGDAMPRLADAVIVRQKK